MEAILGFAELAPAEHQIQLRRAVIASTIGTAIEWYEASGIAAQTFDNTRADRISDSREHDGQSAIDMLYSCHGYRATG